MVQRPSPDLWEDPEIQRILADRNITRWYQELCAAGMRQRDIAELTGQSQSEVSEILKGRRVLAYDLLVRIADGLGIPRGHMGLAYTDAEEYCPGSRAPDRVVLSCQDRHRPRGAVEICCGRAGQRNFRQKVARSGTPA